MNNDYCSYYDDVNKTNEYVREYDNGYTPSIIVSVNYSRKIGAENENK